MMPPSTGVPAVEGGEDAKRDRKRDRDDHGEEREFDRRGQRAQHDVDRGLAVAQRLAEVALGDVAM
jgi:hypothetical protein